MTLHLAEIATTVAPGAHAVLVLDGAGWHRSDDLVVPPNLTLLKLPPYAPELNSVENVVYLPPYTPELQPAETLWVHVDEPIVNKHFDTLADLDAVLGERCKALADDRDLIRGQAGFHCGPTQTFRSNHPELVLAV